MLDKQWGVPLFYYNDNNKLVMELNGWKHKIAIGIDADNQVIIRIKDE